MHPHQGDVQTKSTPLDFGQKCALRAPSYGGESLRSMRTFFLPILFLASAVVCRAQQTRYQITIEAYVDGPSSLRFTPSGFYWHNGENAKTGRQNARNEPTFVNGKPWKPKWRKNGTESNTYQWSVPKIELTWELVSVTVKRGGRSVERRDLVDAKRENGEYSIGIADHASGARWYKLIVRASDPPLPGNTPFDSSPGDLAAYRKAYREGYIAFYSGLWVVSRTYKQGYVPTPRQQGWMAGNTDASTALIMNRLRKAFGKHDSQ
jgi:hypothetical protein